MLCGLNHNLFYCSNLRNVQLYTQWYLTRHSRKFTALLKKLGKMSYPNSYVSHTSCASYASSLYLDPWHQVASDLSDLENMLDDFGSAEAETFPTDDDETEVFPSDQEEPDRDNKQPSSWQCSIPYTGISF